MRIWLSKNSEVPVREQLATQIILGILTVLSGIAVWLAVIHQATGALLVAGTVWGAHVLGSTRTRKA